MTGGGSFHPEGHTAAAVPRTRVAGSCFFCGPSRWASTTQEDPLHIPVGIGAPAAGAGLAALGLEQVGRGGEETHINEGGLNTNKDRRPCGCTRKTKYRLTNLPGPN